jgi:hypothetical protein
VTKKHTNAQEILDAVDATPVAISQEQEQREHAEYTRRNALDRALEHHKINGGMLTVAQLIDNAKQFHAFITGETA